MKKFYCIFAILMVAILSVSCSDESNVIKERDSKIKVVTLGEYLSAHSRTSEPGNVDEPVLDFEDEEVYLQTLEMLRGMDDEQRLDYFESIGFDGAYSIMSKADTELENIFDEYETDSIGAEVAINEYLAKYTGVLDFNEEDENDVTPSLVFEGEDLQLIGSVSGYVIIDDEFITPENYDYDDSSIDNKDDSGDSNVRSRAGFSIGFKEYTKTEVKNGKYHSYFRFGRNGNYLGFKVETYRKLFLRKKYDRRCGYDGLLEIWDSKNQNGQTYVIKTKSNTYSLKEAPAMRYAPRVNMKITDFSSTLNSDNKKTHTKLGMLIK